MFRYNEFPPSVALQGHVECLWELQATYCTPETMRIVSDGKPEIIIQFGESVEELNGTTWVTQPRRLIAGQLTRPMFLRYSGRVHTLGVRLKSWAAYSFFHVPATELVDCVAEIRLLSKKFDDDLASLATGEGAGERLLTDLQSVLEARLCSALVRDSGIEHAVRLIERVGIETVGVRTRPLRTNEIARAMGLSLRQMERRFNQQIGVSPKTYLRVVRIHRLMQRLLRDPDGSNLAALADEYGLADQSHLNLEFRKLVGLTPASTLSGAGDLASFFITTRTPPPHST
jgi:AraC-like DNA-binding protein